MENILESYEERRKTPIKFIVYSHGWFMCQTNWSKTYSAGVIEYKTKAEAAKAGQERIDDEPAMHTIEIYAFNEFGERIQ